MTNRFKNSVKLQNDHKWIKMVANTRWPPIDGHLELAAISNHLKLFFSLTLFLNRFVIWKEPYIRIFKNIISKLPPQLSFQFGNLSSFSVAYQSSPQEYVLILEVNAIYQVVAETPGV